MCSSDLWMCKVVKERYLMFLIALLSGVRSSSKGKQQVSANSLPTKLPSPTPPTIDGLGNARARVQEEITREFALIMASGSLRASEAAALAARRVLERHRIGGVTSGQA